MRNATSGPSFDLGVEPTDLWGRKARNSDCPLVRVGGIKAGAFHISDIGVAAVRS